MGRGPLPRDKKQAPAKRGTSICKGLRKRVYLKMPSIPKIKIEQQRAEIGINITQAQMHISNPRRKMRITYEAPKMEIENTMPSFKINRKKINSETGLKSPLELTMQGAAKGREGGMRGARKALEDGNFLGDIRNYPGDKIGELARNRTRERLGPKQINIGLMPESSPEVTWERGHMRMSWSKHSLVIDWEGDYAPEVTVDPPHSVEVYLNQKPYFRVLVEEGDPPESTPGRQVNTTI